MPLLTASESVASQISSYLKNNPKASPDDVWKQIVSILYQGIVINAVVLPVTQGAPTMQVIPITPGTPVPVIGTGTIT
jgi:hypothetical protein